MQQQTQQGNAVIIILILIALAGGGWYYLSSDRQGAGEAMEGDEMRHEGEAMMKDDKMDKETVAMMMEKAPAGDAMVKEVDTAMQQEMMAMSYDYEGNLLDVTGGSDVRGINTAGESSGTAKATFADGVYSLVATFSDLPDPVGTDFYEGWVVRRGADFSVISTGSLEKTDGVYTNIYSSGTDLTDHDFYVLTLEPDDGDPSPADHIVEGVMTKQ